METVEQKPKANIFIFIIIIILIAAIAIVYFVFFAPEKIARKQSTTTTVNVATEEAGTTNQKSTVALPIKPATSSLDVTGGLSGLQLTPDDILNNAVFQSLHSYAEPVELPSLGRPNPFVPY